MNPAELRLHIDIERESMSIVVGELMLLADDVIGREASLRERAAAATFLAQFYTGVENILKRISYYFGVALPSGDTWHIELFRRFCSPPFSNLPTLFDAELAEMLAPYRRFRHVAIHSYAFQIEWTQMHEGIAQIQEVYRSLNAQLNVFLDDLDRKR